MWHLDTETLTNSGATSETVLTQRTDHAEVIIFFIIIIIKEAFRLHWNLELGAGKSGHKSVAAMFLFFPCLGFCLTCME